ncbi:hypothetical protein F2Q69_00046056 [Brassica cretica]|uniref:Uncharacterized protein n=1 Tax=Brassica cretica TaxID=69181 RepID=A0A8S9PNB1_BRACR|nr:hypothetical protein F2Q69_00046056 [Brassica cretica]
MDGLMSYRCFGRARSLRSDRAWLMFGRYAATKRDERSNLSVAGLGMFPMAYVHEMSPYLQPENADRHVGIGVSRHMHSSHAASHVDVGVSLYMSLSQASRHVCARVSPHMRPEACRLTQRRSCGAFSLARDF